MRRRYTKTTRGFENRNGELLPPFVVNEHGIVRNLQGGFIGEVDALTITLIKRGGKGADTRSDSVVSDLLSASSQRDGVAPPPVENISADTGANAVGVAGGELPGMAETNEGLRLFQEWVRIFNRDPAKVLYGPSKKRAAKKALAEAPFALCVKALEGAKAWRVDHRGSIEFTDILGTYRGTGDLSSRIEFFAQHAGSDVVSSTQDALLARIPSAQRPMVRERMRHVEAMLAAPSGNRGVVEAGELAQAWLRERQIEASVGPDGLTWRRSTRTP